MAQYIERTQANGALIYNTHLEGSELEEAVNAICAIPAADVAPVVRCKVCQNSYEWTNAGGDTYRYCGYLRCRWNHDYDRLVDDDDFCKWGAKMDGGKE